MIIVLNDKYVRQNGSVVILVFISIKINKNIQQQIEKKLFKYRSIDVYCDPRKFILILRMLDPNDV